MPKCYKFTNSDNYSVSARITSIFTLGFIGHVPFDPRLLKFTRSYICGYTSHSPTPNPSATLDHYAPLLVNKIKSASTALVIYINSKWSGQGALTTNKTTLSVVYIYIYAVV